VIEENGSSGLSGWIADGAMPDAMCGRVLASPRFVEAAQTLATNMLAAGDGDSALSAIFKVAVRYVVALVALHLDLSGGLTLPRLKLFCAGSGFLSPGRARAVLLYLRYLGYVESDSERPRGQPRRYRTTSAFVAAWRIQCVAALRAASIIDPQVQIVLARFGEEEVFSRFVRLHAELLLTSAPSVDQKSALVDGLLHRSAGSQVAWTLLTSGTDDFPPRVPTHVSTASMAKRFSVSRIHIRRVLDAAERRFLLRRDGDGGICFADASRDVIRLFYAQQLMHLLDAAARTLTEQPGLSPALKPAA